MPFGSSDEGLPIGVQIVGRHFEEATILRVGAALEDLHRPRRGRPFLVALQNTGVALQNTGPPAATNFVADWDDAVPCGRLCQYN